MISKSKIYTSFGLTLFLICIISNANAQTFNFSHNGLTRQYIYYEPKGIPEQAPLVFVLHGYSGDAYSIKDYTQMNKIADQNKFSVCYPRGTKDEWDNNFWQVGYEFHESETVDDVDFICKLAEYLQSEHNLSNENTFVTGMSNGGDMSFLLACQGNHVFKAFAPVCGTIMNNRIDFCSSPVPIFAINGDKDNTTWYNGDPNNEGEWGPYLGIPEIIDRFVEVNECTSNITTSLPNTNPNDGSDIKFDRYFNGLNNNEVWLYRVINGGHDWPGGSGNMDINASEEVWSFFNQFLVKTGIENIGKEKHAELKIYPNPSNGKIFNISTNINGETNIRIVNIAGIEVYSSVIDIDNTLSIELNNHLTKGVYYILLSNKRGILSNKVVVN